MAPLPVTNTPRSKPAWQRAVQLVLRAVHITAMGLVLGGIAMGGTHDTLLGSIVVTVASGVLLLAASLAWGCMKLNQGSGYALFAKLALLGLGNVFPGARLGWYLAATLVTCLGSHMPGDWRHWTPAFAAPRVRGADGTPLA